jgi:hypothetical protein
MRRTVGLLGLCWGLQLAAAAAQTPPAQPPAPPDPIPGLPQPSVQRLPDGRLANGRYFAGTGHLDTPPQFTTPAGNAALPTFGSQGVRQASFTPAPSPVGTAGGSFGPGLSPAPGGPFQANPAAPGTNAPGSPQVPGTPGTLAPNVAADALPPERLLPVNAFSVELRLEEGHWVWKSGAVTVRDFGLDRAAAQQALKTLHELRPTEYGVIGTPQPVLEYFLTDGKAPEAILSQRQVVPFDPATLQVVQVNGMWCLRDPYQVLCNFGPHADDARLALEVCRKYGFNQLGFVGGPTPVMTVLLFDPTRRSIDRTKFTAVGAQPLPRSALFVPGAGWVGERITFDPRRVEVRFNRGAWVVQAGGWELAEFGHSEHDAREAERLIQDYQFTEYVRLGASGFGFFLRHGQPVEGVQLGLRSQPFQRGQLDVKPVGRSWALFDGNRPLADFGEHGDEAQQALAVIHHFGFDSLCQIGPASHPLRFLVRGR